MPPVRKSVALIGMMGSGKSTVGALLAERLGWTFYDTDLLLEAAFEKPVARIFEAPGEPVFRVAEELLVRSLMSLESAVVAAGGGLWMSPVARRRLGAFAHTAYLAVPADVLWRRLEGRGVSLRPLLDATDPRGSLERLLREREPVYGLANWRIECGGREPQTIVELIIRRMRSARLIARSGVAA